MQVVAKTISQYTMIMMIADKLHWDYIDERDLFVMTPGVCKRRHSLCHWKVTSLNRRQRLGITVDSDISDDESDSYEDGYNKTKKIWHCQKCHKIQEHHIDQ